MMRFWNGIADDPPVVASPLFFSSLVSSLLRLAVTELPQLVPPVALVAAVRAARAPSLATAARLGAGGCSSSTC